MPTPQREPLRRLSRTERAVLQRIANSSSERIDHVRRATALLAVARTGVFIHAAHEAGLRSGTTVADLVVRFNRHGLAAVHIASGRGRRATYNLSARAQIVATAQRVGNDRAIDAAVIDARMLRRPGRSPRCNARCAEPACRVWVPAPSGACSRMPAVRTSGRGPGVRLGQRSASAKLAW